MAECTKQDGECKAVGPKIIYGDSGEYFFEATCSACGDKLIVSIESWDWVSLDHL